MFLVYQFSKNQNPEALSQALWRQHVGHRIIVNNGVQELWLQDSRYKPVVDQLIQMYEGEPNNLGNIPIRSAPSLWTKLLLMWQIYPGTLLTVVFALLVAGLTELGQNNELVSYLTISRFVIEGNQLYFMSLMDVLNNHQYWRLVSPAFLHFSLMHLAFNLLWIWSIGRQLEQLLGTLVWSLGFVVIAMLSNVLQYTVSGTPLFGGLSGVVYGCIGFAWAMPLLNKAWPRLISSQLMIFFLVWLVMGYTSILATIGLGNMANTAHLVGLITGLVLAWVYWLFTKRRYE